MLLRKTWIQTGDRKADLGVVPNLGVLSVQAMLLSFFILVFWIFSLCKVVDDLLALIICSFQSCFNRSSFFYWFRVVFGF